MKRLLLLLVLVGCDASEPPPKAGVAQPWRVLWQTAESACSCNMETGYSALGLAATAEAQRDALTLRCGKECREMVQ